MVWLGGKGPRCKLPKQWQVVFEAKAKDKCQRLGRLEARNRPNKSAKLPNERRLPPDRGQGELRLTRVGGWRMVLRKHKVEIGNS